ncbi:hypothetical protein P9314_17965 [Paenibacillus validus]|uniref:hypothetical protein n=1 Tax=Paenibacillus validus TaxID=44253 RepID=UPI000FDA53FC|nr:hypothetical protein [Paenibacillus validus]MED4602555.1 hypothetical protein [Paenibacillus validus]MED4606080.1 hypothetical protein [Paenibacillus validus]
MKKIKVKPFQGRPHQAFLIDQTNAIRSNGTEIDLIKVVPTNQEGVYAPSEPYNYIQVATGGRALKTLETVVERLKTMSAYALLTEHYDIQEEVFDVMKKRS